MSPKSFRQLREDLYSRSPESRERVDREVERLTEELGLAELRGRASRTQAEVAEVIGTSQSGVSRIERQQDLLVSTLRDYVVATGGRLRILADYGNREVEIRLPVLAESAGQARFPRTFRVIWQNLRTRALVQVGWLEFSGKEFVFRYTPEAELDPDFEPFPVFPELRETYESVVLFPFFAERAVIAGRLGLDRLMTLGLEGADATPVELLARSWGTSPHDTIQIIPEPVERPDGTEVMVFPASGVRHVDEDPDRVTRRVAGLRDDQMLAMGDEPDNDKNTLAIRLEADGHHVGWVPDYLLDWVHKCRHAGRRVSVFVERANGPEAPWHLRLLCRMEIRSPQGVASRRLDP